MCKIDEIQIQTTSARTLTARIDTQGDLILLGHENFEAKDIGDEVGRFAGDLDYARTVKQEFKDTILLWLIKERFTDDSAFDAWLEEKRVPAEFHNVE